MKAYIVDAAALRQNLQNLKARAADATLWAVLKGNGYGLGLLPMAAACRDAGIDCFAITEPQEAELLRSAGFTSQQLLMLRPTCNSDEIRRLLACNVILTVSSSDDAAVLNGIAAQLNLRARVHLKIDTGMGRYGFLPSEMDKLLQILNFMDGLQVVGIYTHLHSAFCSQLATQAQAEAFKKVLATLDAAGCAYGMPHMLNSAGLLRYPEYRMGGVRVGSAMLGRLSIKGSYSLKRIGFCEAGVEELRWLPKGHTCGYGAGWRAKKPTRTAVLSVGWYHGFGCQMGNDLFRFRDCARGVLSNLKGMLFRRHLYVTLNGKKCRVLGHIGMLHTVIDVTKVPCALGDKAILDINPLMLKGMEIIYR